MNKKNLGTEKEQSDDTGSGIEKRINDQGVGIGDY
jgi:hypothetical protein